MFTLKLPHQISTLWQQHKQNPQRLEYDKRKHHTPMAQKQPTSINLKPDFLTSLRTEVCILIEKAED